jgi:hypothetical protein
MGPKAKGAECDWPPGIAMAEKDCIENSKTRARLAHAPSALLRNLRCPGFLIAATGSMVKSICLRVNNILALSNAIRIIIVLALPQSIYLDVAV